jgi:hypothetical protein
MSRGSFYRREEAVETDSRLAPAESDGESLPGTALLRADPGRQSGNGWWESVRGMDLDWVGARFRGGSWLAGQQRG